MAKRTSEMRHQTRLHKRGGTYYFRRKIPVDLRGTYGDKDEIKFSLNTKDRHEAVRLVNIKSVEYDREFEQRRRSSGGLPGNSARTPITHLDEETVQSICSTWLHCALDTDDRVRSEGLDREYLEDLGGTLAQNERELKHALATGNTEPIRPALSQFLSLLGIELDCDEASYKRLAYAFLQAVTKGIDCLKQRDRGEPIETHVVAPAGKAFQPQPEIVGRLSLESLCEDWRIAVPGRPGKTVNDFRATIRVFAEFTKNKPAEDLKRVDFIAYRDHLLQVQKLGPKTVEKKLSQLSTVLQFAVENEKLPANPVSRIKIAKQKVPELSRLPYSADDINGIFSCPIYTTGARPKAGGGAAAAWLPLLGLFTGARLEELGQLCVKDIQHIPEVCWYIEITDADGNQRVKTVSSRRRIPIHAELIHAGFLRYWEQMKESGADRLFPDLRPDNHDSHTGNWSKWWGRYARGTIGIVDPRKVYHSFRHTFKHACREAGMGEEIHDALTGHAGGGVGRSYGGQQYPLAPLAEAMARLKYPGIKVPMMVPGE